MNTKTADIKNNVRVVFMTKPTKKHPYTIPITKEREKVFITGQKLSYKKMIGEAELTDEEVKRYPVVINPQEFYKVTHMQPFNRLNDYDNAIITLLLLSGKVAESKMAYNETPVEFVGYIKDELAESDAYILVEDERFEAEEAVRKSTIDDYEKIALIVNYRLGTNINVKTMPDSYIKAELIKAAKENPKEVKKCFPKWNPAVAQDIWILQLIKHDILSKKPNGDIFDNGEFIGNGIESVINFTRLESKKEFLNKWKMLLDQKLGLVSKKLVDKYSDSMTEDQRLSKYKSVLDKLKVALVDENLKGAEFHFDVLKNDFSDFFDLDTESSMTAKVDDLKLRVIEKNRIVEIKKFEQELNELDLDKIQRKISHPKTPFVQETCKEFWENKNELIEYMLTVKFPE